MKNIVIFISITIVTLIYGCEDSSYYLNRAVDLGNEKYNQIIINEFKKNNIKYNIKDDGFIEYNEKDERIVENIREEYTKYLGNKYIKKSPFNPEQISCLKPPYNKYLQAFLKIHGIQNTKKDYKGKNCVFWAAKDSNNLDTLLDKFTNYLNENKISSNKQFNPDSGANAPPPVN